MNVISLVFDAYGGRGGIALYNRYYLKALSLNPKIRNIYVFSMDSKYEINDLPDKVNLKCNFGKNYINYLTNIFKTIKNNSDIKLVICGHLHLLPIAKLISKVYGAKLSLIIYGVESHKPTRHFLVNFLAKKTENLISIRNLTSKKFLSWAKPKDCKSFYLPNCIDISDYGIEDKKQFLIDKYNLSNKRVLLTIGRIDTGIIDERKGFDEIIEVLPKIRKEIPNIFYLILGDGDDINRLKNKCKKLGVDNIVKFIGYVEEKEKADYIRLADVYVMPGSNEIFDRYPFRFVFLEALACGIPVVGSELIDEIEKNDIDASSLIIQVNPKNHNSIIKGIKKGLAQKSKIINPILSNYYFCAFTKKVHKQLDKIISF